MGTTNGEVITNSNQLSNLDLDNVAAVYQKEWQVLYYSEDGKSTSGKTSAPPLDVFPEKRLNPYFDALYYSTKYNISTDEALPHFIRFGQKQTFSPCKSLAGKVKKLSSELGPSWFKEFLVTPNVQQYIHYRELDDCQKVYEIMRTCLFDTNWYCAKYSKHGHNRSSALKHYALIGIFQNEEPNEFFNSSWYRNRYNLSAQTISLLDYFSNWKTSRRVPSPQFDAQRYLALHRDVKNHGIEPLKHFLNFGKTEGRKVYEISNHSTMYEMMKRTSCFLETWYLNVNEDLRGSDIDPVEHYITYGEKENRRPNPYFYPAWYAKHNRLDANESPLAHYLTQGWKDNAPPSPQFDAKAYIESNSIDTKHVPLEHYLSVGKKQGLPIFPFNEKAQASLGDASAQTVKDKSLRGLIENTVVKLHPTSRVFCAKKLNIHWVIPDFSIGAGGHMTIFRMIRWLEIFGHKNTIWIYNPSSHKSANTAYEDIIKGFQQIGAHVKFIHDGFSEAQGDVIVATDWGSVSYATRVADFKRRFYFVQDHEPDFYAMGSQRLAAESSYQNDIDCICAGPWLSHLMDSKYGLWARHFWLSVDTDIYNCNNVCRENSTKIFRIAFYARHSTPRRAVELGLLALEVLGRSGANIEVHTFGDRLRSNKTPFSCVEHGKLCPEELADVYRRCDLGIVFSATNYSLVPQEMMACGLPVAELDCDSTRAIFDKTIVAFLSPHPLKMAKEIRELMFDYIRLNTQATCALKWLDDFSWEKSARIIEKGFVERLEECEFFSVPPKPTKQVVASVVIPTFNGGNAFKQVIQSVCNQRVPWPYEVIVVDSGSTDGTLEEIAKYPLIQLHTIKASSFQHGRTRNYAISHAKGEFVAILTHDALPENEFWLHNIVAGLNHYPDAAGAFGKHYAYPHADPFTKRDLTNHFQMFDNSNVAVDRQTNSHKYETGNVEWRRQLHFYSDNNSCLRKSIWNKFPYPEINFGEDQAWADLVIRHGYKKVYASRAAVFHSHDFDEGDVEKRAFEEAQFFKKEFGYLLLNNRDLAQCIQDANRADIDWAKDNAIPQTLLDRRLSSNAARLRGFHRAEKNAKINAAE